MFSIGYVMWALRGGAFSPRCRLRYQRGKSSTRRPYYRPTEPQGLPEMPSKTCWDKLRVVREITARLRVAAVAFAAENPRSGERSYHSQ